MDYILEEIAEVSVSKVVKWVCAGIMIFGGVVPYIPQYREIKQAEDADGFSLFVCLALLIANTLRILFWFGKKYEIPLLIQSIIMDFTMLVMVHLCVKIKNKNQIVRARERIFTVIGIKVRGLGGLKSPRNNSKISNHHSFSDLDWQYFWAWTDFVSYVDFMLIFTVLSSLLMFLFVDYVIFVEIVGFLALFTEALLGAPQLFRNFQNKSTEGMSMKMVIMWSVGDTFKTCYFIAKEAPIQFWLCGGLQMCIDIFILGQVYWYRKNIGARSKKQDSSAD